MSDEKPDPLSDALRGIGLLLRAAKTTVERVPKKGLETAVLETAREVGRALENVAETVEREVFGRKNRSGSDDEHGSKANGGKGANDRKTDGSGKPPEPPGAS